MAPIVVGRSLCYVLRLYGELPIEQYVKATRGKLVSFNSAKSGLPVGVCCTTMQPSPNELHSAKDYDACSYGTHSTSHLHKDSMP